MNKLIITLLAVGFVATACYGSDGLVTVRQNGTYTVGDDLSTFVKKYKAREFTQDNEARVGGYNKPNRDTRIQKPKR
jgi:hypothetical protein